MSDVTPDKRKGSGWIIWAAGIALVLYPLSIGPAFWCGMKLLGPGPNPGRQLSFGRGYGFVYRPIFSLADSSPLCMEILDNYLFWWSP